MVVVQAGLDPLLNTVVTVCGMRMQSMQEIELICQENFGSCCGVHAAEFKCNLKLRSC